MLQKFDSVPTFVGEARILRRQAVDENVNLVLNLITVHHCVLCMVIVTVGGVFLLLLMMMDQRILGDKTFVMLDCMHQDRKSGPFPCGYWDCRDAKHLRETVQVDFHSSLFYDIHHIESQYDWFPKLD